MSNSGQKLFKVGQPPVFDSPEELIEAIEKVLNTTEGKLTLTGLAIGLGFASRQSLYDYEKDSKYSYIIKRARLFVENEYEKRLGEGSGVIFALKNMGWSDNQGITLSGDPENPLITKIVREIVRSND